MEFKAIQKMVYREYIRNRFKAVWDNITPKFAGDLAELGLIVTEVAEAMECIRNADYEILEEELADIVIRVMNFASRLNIDLEYAVISKSRENLSRRILHDKKKI